MSSPSEEESPICREIDENLKRIFDETAQQPLPQTLTDLIERLRQKKVAK